MSNTAKFEIKQIGRADVLRAEADGLQYGKNKEAGRLIQILIGAGAFGNIRNTAGLERQMYKADASRELDHMRGRSQKAADRTYGYNRLRNLCEGKASFIPDEANILHDGFREVFGDDWADQISAQELVTTPLKATFAKALSSGLPWPEDRLSPVDALMVLALASQDELSVAPALTDTPRLGVAEGSRNAELGVFHTLPTLKVGTKYVLHVNGLKPQDEQVLLFETSRRELAFNEEQESYQGFPIAVRPAEVTNLTQKDGDEAYTIADIKGEFSFFAIAFPKVWKADELFGLDAEAERWSAETIGVFVKALRRQQATTPGVIRIAHYTYEVI